MESVLLEEIRFDERGLVPAVVQDAENGQVLMVAYMNAESLELTLQEGRTVFWSRSRHELWSKGATSGNVQHVKAIRVDCDADTLLFMVHQDGAACHTCNRSCFYRRMRN